MRLKCRIKSDKVFCDTKCKNEWQRENFIGKSNPKWRGGWEKYYGVDWDKQKNLTRKRDDYSCKICGVTENEKAHDVHHVHPFRKFGFENYKIANDLSNLVTLCSKCHSSVEGKNEMLLL